jgi:integrase
MAIQDLWEQWNRKVKRANERGLVPPGRPSKRWMADTYVLGERVFKAFHKKNEAEAWIGGEKKRELDGELGIRRKPRIGFRTLCRKFLEEKEGQRSRATLKYYLNQIRPFLAPFFGDTSVDQITREQIVRYIHARLNTVHRGHTIHPLTVNKEVATLRRLFKYASVAGYLVVEDPTLGIQPLKAKAKKRIRFLSEDELDRFLGVCVGKTYTYFLLVADLGLRRNEAWHCRWEWIDWHRRVVRVTQGDGFRTKSHEDREIPMTDRLFDHLRALPGAREGLVVPGRPDPQKRTVEALHSCAVRELPGLTLKAKLEPFTTHDLRHTYASRLVMRGVELYTVAKLLGHKDVKTTQIYAHLSPDYLKGAVALLNERPRARLQALPGSRGK